MYIGNINSLFLYDLLYVNYILIVKDILKIVLYLILSKIIFNFLILRY